MLFSYKLAFPAQRIKSMQLVNWNRRLGVPARATVGPMTKGSLGTDDQAMKREPCIHRLYIAIAECAQLGSGQPEQPPKHQCKCRRVCLPTPQAVHLPPIPAVILERSKGEQMGIWKKKSEKTI